MEQIEITAEKAITLDEFIVLFRTSRYVFKKESKKSNYWNIYGKNGSRSGIYYEDDILRASGFTFFKSKPSNIQNY